MRDRCWCLKCDALVGWPHDCPHVGGIRYPVKATSLWWWLLPPFACAAAYGIVWLAGWLGRR